jgi:hypothetical protein
VPSLGALVECLPQMQVGPGRGGGVWGGTAEAHGSLKGSRLSFQVASITPGEVTSDCH